MPRVVTAALIADFRRRLTAAASELLAERGIDGFTMRELAKRLRVSPMTAYRYFKDKEEILGELRARGFARLADALDEAQAGGDARNGTVRAYVRFARENPTAYRLMFDGFQPPGREPGDVMVHQQRVRDTLAATCDDAAGAILWSALHGALALHLAGKLESAALERTLGGIFALTGERQRPDESSAQHFPAALSAAE